MSCCVLREQVTEMREMLLACEHQIQQHQTEASETQTRTRQQMEVLIKQNKALRCVIILRFDVLTMHATA